MVRGGTGGHPDTSVGRHGEEYQRRPAGRGPGLPLAPVVAVVKNLIGRFGDDPGVVLRYLGTSAVNLVNHQILLQLAVRAWDWSGGQANVFAAVVAAFPAYLLSRYWVWQVDGRPSLRAEVLPFWTIALLGLLASTAAAITADRLFDAPIMISVGSLAGYFVVWVLKFLFLDRLFNRAADAQTVPVA